MMLRNFKPFNLRIYSAKCSDLVIEMVRAIYRALATLTTSYLSDKFAGCMEDPFLNGEQISLANPRENTGVLLNSCPTHTF